MPLDATRIGIFAAARYRVLTGALPLDLYVGQRNPHLNECWPGARSFALITACNPGGMPLDEAVNAARQRQLSTRVEAAGVTRLPTLASDVDGRFAEPGWLLCDPEPQWRDEIARSFGQMAILAWRADLPVRLRCYGENPGVPLAQTAHIDFVG